MRPSRPQAALPSPAARRAPAAAATAAQIENFCEKFSIESICYRIFCETLLFDKMAGPTSDTDVMAVTHELWSAALLRPVMNKTQ